mgnify:FL=1
MLSFPARDRINHVAVKRRPIKNINGMSKEQFSFNKGWSQLRQCDTRECRKRLMEVFGLTTNAAFCQRKRGAVIPNVVQAAKVEAIFKDYGIKDIWGA